MNRILSLVLSNLLLFSSCVTTNPVIDMVDGYIKIEKRNYIVPYSINLIALTKLKKNSDLTKVKKYMDWVFDNLNYPDKHGLTGSIYDFIIDKDGTEIITEKYDSIDSYSATFLMVLDEYLRLTGNKKYFLDNRQKIEDITYTIAYLQDKDGLTVAIPKSDIKYLMDNCEVYAGIVSYLRISEKLGWDKKDYYQNVLDKLKKGILFKLYNNQELNFDWAVDNIVKHESSWDTFYPDSYSQLFPILFGLLEDDNNENTKIHLWKTYEQMYKTRELPFEQKIIYELTKERMIQ